MTTPNAFEQREISPGVIEVYDGEHQVGLITFNPASPLTYYATYANADTNATIPYRSGPDALAALRLQHEAVRRLTRSIRSIRPAPELRASQRDVTWDQGYNSALRDVERILQEFVGQAPEGEGFTAITRPTN